jgi:putative membrane protein
MKFLISWLCNIIALYVAALIVPGVFYHGSFWPLVLAALVFGILNMLVRPVLIFLTLPAVIVTFGLFILIINALMLYITSAAVHQYHIGGFWSTIGAVIVISIINLILHSLIRDDKGRRGFHGGPHGGHHRSAS